MPAARRYPVDLALGYAGVVNFDGDPLDLALAHALQLDGRAPFRRIASVLGVSDHTVARRYARLRADGLLRVRGLADPARIGQTQWFVRVQCTPSAAGQLADALARRPDTAWVSLSSGGTQVVCVLRTSPGEDGNLLLQTLPNAPRVTGVTAHCALHAFLGNRRSVLNKTGALTPEQVAGLQPLRSEVDSRRVVLDDEDQRLVTALGKDGRAGFTELASATGWSQTTVRRRLAELTDNGVLYFDVDFDPVIIGMHLQTILWLSVAPDRLTAAGEALATHPTSAYVAATTGVSNLYAIIMSSDTEALYQYLTTEVAALPGIQHLETAPVIRTVKSTG
jgi:DNA-binding Lrp family transcriptional regulator